MEDRNYLRLMTAMIAEMHQKAGIDDGVNSKLVCEALWAKQDWAITWEHQFLLDGEDSPPDVSYVCKVLNMWRWIEACYDQLDEADKEKLATAVPYSVGKSPKFGGFDGNNEGNLLGITRMLAEKMGRWDEFADRDLNTHSPTGRRYGLMLGAFEEVEAERGHDFYRGPHFDSLVKVLSAPYQDKA